MNHQISPKTCDCCGRVLTRKRFPSGRLEDRTAFSKRRFCSLSCSSTRREDTRALKIFEVEQLGDKFFPPPAATGQKKQTSIEFLESVVNDCGADLVTRVQAAKALLPYQAKKAEKMTGKKQKKEEAAKEAGKGIFKAMQGPKVLKFSREG